MLLAVVVRRHNAVVRLVGVMGTHIVLERRPQLDHHEPDGTVIESRSFLPVTLLGETSWIVVVISHPWCTDAKDTQRALERTYKKHRHGSDAVSFALETGGRWGELAAAW